MKVLGSLQEIIVSGAKEFETLINGQPEDIFVVYHQGKVFGYKNICPHQKLTLNWMPDEFLNHDKTLIQCSNHDALFRINDGVCIAGPCVGECLSPVIVKIEDKQILVVDDIV